MKQDTVTVLNTPCILTTRAKLTADIYDVCRSERSEALSVDFTNVHIVAARHREPEFLADTSGVDWFVSDSQILTWAIGWLGGTDHERCYGPDFLDYFVKNADASLTHYFLGASQDCLDKLLEYAHRTRPEIQIVGSHNGYFQDADNARIVADINAAKPDVLWVGLGTPKQQKWINDHKSQLKVGAALAVGFAFDVNAGTKKDAPAWLGKVGLTWLYRLACEPKRLFKRYFVYNTYFVTRLLVQIARS